MSLQISDLRIGNYINDSKGKSLQIWNINSDGYLNKGYTHSKMIGSCGGIELTEEILLKAGFTKGQSNFKGYFYKDLWDNKTLLISLEQNQASIYFKANIAIVLTDNIKSLHKLQNLWFSLMETELEINL